MKKPTSAMKKPRLSKRPIDNDNHAGHRRYGTFPRVPAKDPKRDFKVGDKIRVKLLKKALFCISINRLALLGQLAVREPGPGGLGGNRCCFPAG
jgi:hypothetical protein